MSGWLRCVVAASYLRGAWKTNTLLYIDLVKCGLSSLWILMADCRHRDRLSSMLFRTDIPWDCNARVIAVVTAQPSATPFPPLKVRRCGAPLRTFLRKVICQFIMHLTH